MLLVAVVNAAGLLCMCAATDARDPLTWQRAGDASTPVLGSIGFTLMLPGSFFAAAVFLCAHVLLRDDRTARAVWYAAALLINLLLSWKFGAAYEAARR